MIDKGMMSDTAYGYVAKIKTAINSTTYGNTSVALDIKNLVAGAKNATSAALKTTVNATTASFTLSGDKYVSNNIAVSSNMSWSVSFVSAPSGTTYSKTSTGFVVYVPKASVAEGSTIYFDIVINSTANATYVYKYSASNSAYQDMYFGTAEPVSQTNKVLASIYRPAPVVQTPTPTPTPTPTVTATPALTKIYISKLDSETGKAVSGARLVVKDSSGNIVDRWTSTTTAHELDEVPVGTYTLIETIAPSGYVLSDEKITFTVANDGKTKTITMYNTPEKEEPLPDLTKITISKKDIKKY